MVKYWHVKCLTCPFPKHFAMRRVFLKRKKVPKNSLEVFEKLHSLHFFWYKMTPVQWSTLNMTAKIWLKILFLISLCQTEMLKYEILGPFAPLQIFLSRRKNDLLATWMKYLMLDCSYLGSICQAIGSKFDQNLNLNFPSLFSDWSIQKFLETNSKNFWINQSEKR